MKLYLRLTRLKQEVRLLAGVVVMSVGGLFEVGVVEQLAEQLAE